MATAYSWYRQFRYQPYGEVYEADRPVSGVTESLSSGSFYLSTNQFHHGMWWDSEIQKYSARARIYDPKTGRFITPDPNGQAVQLASVMRMNAQSASASASLNYTGQYSDGMNPYSYVRNNPVTGKDPSGLNSDMWDDVDDIAANYYADRAAFQIEVMDQAKALISGFQAALTAMMERMVIETAATAIWAHAPYAFAINDTADAILHMVEFGLSWGGIAGLAAELYFGKKLLEVGPSLGIKWNKGYKASAGTGLAVNKKAFNFHLEKAELNYRGIRPKSFSITDWSGYPAGVRRPSGPFRLLDGNEYVQARNANRKLRRQNPEKWGAVGSDIQIHEIHPVKYGGSPTDPANKVALPQPEHSKYNSFWARMKKK